MAARKTCNRGVHEATFVLKSSTPPNCCMGHVMGSTHGVGMHLHPTLLSPSALFVPCGTLCIIVGGVCSARFSIDGFFGNNSHLVGKKQKRLIRVSSAPLGWRRRSRDCGSSSTRRYLLLCPELDDNQAISSAVATVEALLLRRNPLRLARLYNVGCVR